MPPLNRLAVTALLLAAAPLAAQRGEKEDVQLRNDCRLAEQIIRSGNPAPHRGWAYSFITLCPESGPAALASRWREDPADERTLQQLAIATSRFRTREMFTAVSGAARSQERAPLLRVYALALLFAFAEPGSSVRVRDLLQGREDRSVRVYRISGDGDRSNPVGDVKAEVEALLAEIIASGGEPSVVRAATALQQLL